MNLNELMPQLEELKAEVLKLIEKNNNQQAEIDFLKKEILEKHEDWKHEGQQAANARAEIEALKEKLELTVPKDSQDWKGMDGATAFWLVERHSNHWGDAKLMMEEWRDTNTHPVKELTDEEIIHIWNTCETDDEVEELVMKDFILFARAILRKVQESDKIESLGTINIGGVHFKNGKEVK